ncbi:MAG: hypothetical protein GY906_06065 [bacterium]|nr:hypothetical protein [bacterium]
MAAPTPPQPPPVDGPPPQPPSPTPPATLPWEDPSRPIVEALFETIKLFVMSPTEAFHRMAPSGSLARPVVYLIVLGWIGVIFSQVYSIAFGGIQLPFAEDMYDPAAMGVSLGFNIGAIVLAPIIILFFAGIQLLVIHLMLLIVGGATRDLSATLRVICYAATPQLLSIIPLCGGFAALVWAIVLLVIGLSVVHSTTHAKALIAVLLPIVLCCLACVGVGVLGGVFAALAAQ